MPPFARSSSGKVTLWANYRMYRKLGFGVFAAMKAAWKVVSNLHERLR